MTGSRTQMGDAYVSVGFAADFPDKCLVTFAFPSTDDTLQFIESGGSSPMGPFSVPTNGTVGGLPESTKDWNATLSEDGTLRLG